MHHVYEYYVSKQHNKSIKFAHKKAWAGTRRYSPLSHLFQTLYPMKNIAYILNNKWNTFIIVAVIAFLTHIPFRENFIIKDGITSEGEFLITEGALFENGMAYILFVNAIILLSGFVMFLSGKNIGVIICRASGLISSFSIAIGAYFIYGAYPAIYLISVLIWALGWWFGLKKSMSNVVKV